MVRYIYYDGKFVELPRYIYQDKRNGCFEIRKRIGGIPSYWGSFLTLEEAKLYLSYYIGKHWMVNPNFVCNVREPHYIQTREDNSHLIVKKINGKKKYFGTFHNLSDAENERDICMACNWDMDLIVEFGDSIEV